MLQHSAWGVGSPSRSYGTIIVCALILLESWNTQPSSPFACSTLPASPSAWHDHMQATIQIHLVHHNRVLNSVTFCPCPLGCSPNTLRLARQHPAHQLTMPTSSALLIPSMWCLVWMANQTLCPLSWLVGRVGPASCCDSVLPVLYSYHGVPIMCIMCYHGMMLLVGMFPAAVGPALSVVVSSVF